MRTEPIVVGKIVLNIFAVVVLCCYLASGQSIGTRNSRAQAVDGTSLITLRGNTHPLARSEFDQGAAPANLLMDRMLLVLRRRPEQEASLRKLLEAQQDKTSPNYHKWLTPEQFGEQFGPSDIDIQTVTAWLQSQGFQVLGSNKGRTIIEFSGAAGQCSNACKLALISQSVRRLNPHRLMLPAHRTEEIRLRTWKYREGRRNAHSNAQLDVVPKAEETNLPIRRGAQRVATYMSKPFLILIVGGAIYPMCLRRSAIVCLFACAILGGLAGAADMNRSEACHLPKAAQEVLETKLPGWTVVSQSDLSEHDRSQWKAKHLQQCPGVAAGAYFGSRNLSYAVTLINRQKTTMLQTLVVLRPHDASYDLIELSGPQDASRVLVVFRLKPGVFEDIEKGVKVQSRGDAIAYEDIAAGMLVYAWHGNGFREIQVSE